MVDKTYIGDLKDTFRLGICDFLCTCILCFCLLQGMRFLPIWILPGIYTYP